MSYLIPSATAHAKLEIKRSKFITEVRHITDPAQLKAWIGTLREAHPKARHHCWAMVSAAPTDSNCYGFSDDGEPSGTAGKPMFNVLQHSGYGQVAVVITRYFGGIKLGTGGLVKAYTEATKLGLEAVEGVEYSPMKQLRLGFGYELEPRVRHFLGQWELGETAFHYDAQAAVMVSIKEALVAAFKQAIEEKFGISIGITQ